MSALIERLVGIIKMKKTMNVFISCILSEEKTNKQIIICKLQSTVHVTSSPILFWNHVKTINKIQFLQNIIFLTSLLIIYYD